jgi:hypothetical protein
VVGVSRGMKSFYTKEDLTERVAKTLYEEYPRSRGKQHPLWSDVSSDQKSRYRQLAWKLRMIIKK